MMDTLDPELIAGYRAMAAQGANFQGLSVLQHARFIGKLIHRTGARTLIDYGCAGAGAYADPHRMHEGWGVERPALYDPAVPAFEAKPVGVFDGVICSDVLEHVPERHVDAVIAELFAYAKLFVFASVCCRPAKKRFPGTGINLHVTVRPFAWWEQKMRAANSANVVVGLVETP